MVRIVLRGQGAAGGLQEEVVDDLVDAVVVPSEPVVDRGQVTQDAPVDAGLLGDLAHGRLLRSLSALQVALGQAPLQAPTAVTTGDDGRLRALARRG